MTFHVDLGASIESYSFLGLVGLLAQLLIDCAVSVDKSSSTAAHPKAPEELLHSSHARSAR